MAGNRDSDALPKPWVKVPKGYSNPVTGQFFDKKKDLDRYLAFCKRHGFPIECDQRNLDKDEKSPKVSFGSKKRKQKGLANGRSRSLREHDQKGVIEKGITIGGQRNPEMKKSKKKGITFAEPKTKHGRRKNDEVMKPKCKRRNTREGKGKAIMEGNDKDEYDDGDVEGLMFREHCPGCGKIGCICFDD